MKLELLAKNTTKDHADARVSSDNIHTNLASVWTSYNNRDINFIANQSDTYTKTTDSTVVSDQLKIRWN